MRKAGKGLCRQEFPRLLTNYEVYLYQQERSLNTIRKYLRDLRAFFSFVDGNRLDKASLLKWKEKLVTGYAPASVNSMLAAVNGFFVWAGWPEYKVKPLKIQRAIFCKQEKELTREEYIRLVWAAEKERNGQLALLLQTICATGIRVSELSYITVEAVQCGHALVNCKGKTRTVFIPNELCHALHRFCRVRNLQHGMIFRTRSGAALDRSNIWRQMKELCKSANVEPGKVFPHNLRHLFARTYYRLEKDLSRLADLLGHSNITTTRIYTMESGTEHAKQLDRLGLVIVRNKKTT